LPAGTFGEQRTLQMRPTDTTEEGTADSDRDSLASTASWAPAPTRKPRVRPHCRAKKRARDAEFLEATRQAAAETMTEVTGNITLPIEALIGILEGPSDEDDGLFASAGECNVEMPAAPLQSVVTLVEVPPVHVQEVPPAIHVPAVPKHAPKAAEVQEAPETAEQRRLRIEVRDRLEMSRNSDADRRAFEVRHGHRVDLMKSLETLAAELSGELAGEGDDGDYPFENLTMAHVDAWKAHRDLIDRLYQAGTGALRVALTEENVVGPLRGDIDVLFDAPRDEYGPMLPMRGEVMPIAQQLKVIDEALETAQDELREQHRPSRRLAEDFEDISNWRHDMTAALEDSMAALDVHMDRMCYIRRIQ
jgi:hypothetical protein